MVFSLDFEEEEDKDRYDCLAAAASDEDDVQYYQHKARLLRHHRRGFLLSFLVRDDHRRGVLRTGELEDEQKERGRRDG